LRKRDKVIMGICMSKNLKELVDIRRGDIPRSVFISKILQQICRNNDTEQWTRNSVDGQWGLSRRQPREGPTDPSARPTGSGGTNG
jgi:hypothetical protein